MAEASSSEAPKLEVLFSLVSSGDVENIKKALDSGSCTSDELAAFEDQEGRSLLHIAAENDRSDMLRFLVSLGIFDVDERQENGSTPLHVASATGRMAAVGELLECNADVNAADEFGDTPLHVAAHEGQVKAMEGLIAGGAAVESRNHFGYSPLHHAVLANSVEACELLLTESANINAQDKFGNTPLHVAMSCGRVEAAHCLVAHGCDETIRNRSDKIAAECSGENGHPDKQNTHTETTLTAQPSSLLQNPHPETAPAAAGWDVWPSTGGTSGAPRSSSLRHMEFLSCHLQRETEAQKEIREDEQRAGSHSPSCQSRR